MQPGFPRGALVKPHHGVQDAAPGWCWDGGVAEYWWVMETPTGPSCQMMVRAEKDVGDGGSRWTGDGGCGELTSKAGGVYD